MLQLTVLLMECLGFSTHMIKTSMRYHLTHVRMATEKKKKTASVNKDVEKLEPLYTFFSPFIFISWRLITLQLCTLLMGIQNDVVSGKKYQLHQKIKNRTTT